MDCTFRPEPNQASVIETTYDRFILPHPGEEGHNCTGMGGFGAMLCFDPSRKKKSRGASPRLEKSPGLQPSVPTF